MSRMENIRSLASQASQTMYTVASVSKEKATMVATASKEKGMKVVAHAAVAASAGRSTLGNRLKQVQTSSTYQQVKQKLWSKQSTSNSAAAADEKPIQFASTEKEYYKVDPATVVKRTKSSREMKRERHPELRRSNTTASGLGGSAPALKRSTSVEATERRRQSGEGKVRAIQEVEF